MEELYIWKYYTKKVWSLPGGCVCVYNIMYDELAMFKEAGKNMKFGEMP